ncbi:MAG: DUF2948 family protein [Rhodothalassiaceae bacterium]
MTDPIMPCVGGLKLLARDDEDLSILSAHLQDALAQVGDLVYAPKDRRFVAQFNRFCWYSGQTNGPWKRYVSVLHLDGVLGAQARNMRQDDRRAVVELLSVLFEPAPYPDAPQGAGDVIMVFSGGGEIRLRVECLEARLKDLVGPYKVYQRPSHMSAEDLDAREDETPEKAAASA